MLAIAARGCAARELRQHGATGDKKFAALRLHIQNTRLLLPAYFRGPRRPLALLPALLPLVLAPPVGVTRCLICH